MYILENSGCAKVCAVRDFTSSGGKLYGAGMSRRRYNQMVTSSKCRYEYMRNAYVKWKASRCKGSRHVVWAHSASTDVMHTGHRLWLTGHLFYSSSCRRQRKHFRCRRSRNNYLKAEINSRIYYTICCVSQLSKRLASSVAQPMGEKNAGYSVRSTEIGFIVFCVYFKSWALTN